MGRLKKRGLDFSPWDIGVLDYDEKIDCLIENHSIAGFTVYFYLCQKAYGSNGYYLDWSYEQCPSIARRLGRGADSKLIERVVDTCLKSGLFDDEVFKSYGVLTSKSMQQRFWEVAKCRPTLTVRSDIWLLQGEFPFEFIDEKKAFTDDKSLNSQNKSGNIDCKCPQASKASKASKAKQTFSPRFACGEYENVFLSEKELEKLRQEFPDYERRIEALSEFIAKTGRVYKNHLATIRSWAKSEGNPKPTKRTAGDEYQDFVNAIILQNEQE